MLVVVVSSLLVVLCLHLRSHTQTSPPAETNRDVIVNHHGYGPALDAIRTFMHSTALCRNACGLLWSLSVTGARVFACER